MFVKRLKKKAAAEIQIPIGRLQGSHLEPRLLSHFGIPSTACLLAYDPLQHLLAISTRDGRIKLFGGNGVEGLLQSGSQASSRFLEFLDNRGVLVHITTHNHVEVWSLEKRELLHVQKWTTAITAFSVIQGSPFMYIGDELGAVSIIEYNDESELLIRMPYCIPAEVVLGQITSAGDFKCHSVVSILPQPESLYSRVVIAYANGLICLWGLQEAHVLAIRGGTEAQHKRFTTYKASDLEPSSSLHSMVDDEDEKDVCCACWACPFGSILAVGYTDGDIYLWDIPSVSKGKGPRELEDSNSAFLSRTPMRKLEVSTGSPRMPVVTLRWCTDGKGEAGRLFVFGGQQMGTPEIVTVVPLNESGDSTEKVGSQLELPLQGSFCDMILLPSVASNSSLAAAAVLVLTTPGQLNIYDEVSITNFLKKPDGLSVAPLPGSILFKLPLTRSSVTASKLVFLPADGIVSKIVFQIPIVLKSYVPPLLKSGTKWPVTGGIANFGAQGRETEARIIYISGHEDGSVNLWDVSSMSLFLIASVELQSQEDTRFNRNSAISALDFCAATGLLAVGNEDGLVCLYMLSSEQRETKCHFIGAGMERSEKVVTCAAGLQCLAILDVHHSSMQCVVISDHTSCLAISDAGGLVSLFELGSFSLYYHGRCFSDVTSSIMAIHLLSNPSAPTTAHKFAGPVVYILAKDSSMAAIELTAQGWIVSGTFQPKNVSVAVSLHLLDSSALDAQSSSVNQSTSSSKDATSGDRQSLADSSCDTNIERLEGRGTSEKYCLSNSSNLFLLLCAEDCLRLYPAAAVVEGDRNSLRKVKLNGQCYWAELFESRTMNAYGLVLLYKSGLMELRSLPDMELLKEQSLSLCLNWKLEPSLISVKTLTCTLHGRIVLIHGEELIYLSVLVEENELRLPCSLPHLYDEDVAAATNAALTASIHSTKKKSQIQDLLGGVIKELRIPAGSGDQPSDKHGALELHRVFSREPFLVSSAPTDSKGSILDEVPVQPMTPTLEIDDIDIADDDVPLPSPAPSKTNLVKRLRKSLQGKRRSSIKEDSDERHKLFEGGKPSVRTAEEIKAAYGHKVTGEASSAAGFARDKLLERQEKLQAINKRTEEMQEGAENFASLAEELAKKMESRKWWEI